MAWSFFLNGLEVEEPIGWDTIVFRAQRMEYSGVDQVFSSDVQFYGEGARFLKGVYDSFFINSSVTFKITTDQAVNNEPWVFIGQVNFALYEETNVCDTDSWLVSVGIIEDNFREKFKSRMGTDLDLFTTKDLDNNVVPALTSATGLRRVRLHSQNFILTGSAKQLSPTSIDISSDLGNYPFHVCPYYWGGSDYKDNYGNSLDVQGFNFTNTNVNFQNNTSYTRNFKLTGNVKFRLKNKSVYDPPLYYDEWKIMMYGDILIRDASHNEVSSTNIGYTGLIYYQGNPDGYPFEETFSWPFDQSITLQAGWSFQIRMYFDSVGPSGGLNLPWGQMFYDFPDDTFLKLDEINAGEQLASPCDGLLVRDYLRRLIYLMTGDPDGLLSATFEEEGDGCYWNNFITTGLQIRNGATPNEGINPQMNINFDEFFKSLHSVFCLGWSYEKSLNGWKIRVEKLDFFYKNEIALEPSNVGLITQRAMSDKLINQVKLGYEDKWKNISLSGVFAIHTGRTYSIANKATRDGTTADLDLTSKFIAEGNTIEFLRRLSFLNNEDNPGSSDRPNDYDLFIIWLNRTGVSIENIVDSGYGFNGETGSKFFAPGTISYNSDFIAFSSSIAKRLYNIYHTPARLAYRHWKVLGMHTFGLADPMLIFQSGEYFTEYESIIDSDDELASCIEVSSDSNLSERGNITLPKMNVWARNYLFRPIEIEFEYPQSFCDFIDLSTNNQFDKIRPSSGSFMQSGYIQSIENKPNDGKGGTTTFTLIASNIADPEPPPEGRAYSEAYSSAYS